MNRNDLAKEHATWMNLAPALEQTPQLVSRLGKIYWNKAAHGVQEISWCSHIRANTQSCNAPRDRNSAACSVLNVVPRQRSTFGSVRNLCTRENCTSVEHKRNLHHKSSSIADEDSNVNMAMLRPLQRNTEEHVKPHNHSEGRRNEHGEWKFASDNKYHKGTTENVIRRTLKTHNTNVHNVPRMRLPCSTLRGESKL